MTLQDSQIIVNPTFYKRTHWLSFLIVRLFTEMFGVTELSLRLPSAIAGVLSVPVMYLLARQMLGCPAAMATAILILLSSYQIHFAHEARYYTEMTLLAAILLLASIQFLKRERIVWVIVMIVSSVALYGIHVSTGIYVITVYLFTVVLLLWLGRHKIVWHHIRYSWKYRLAFIILILVSLAGTALLWRLMGGQVIRAATNLLNISELKRTPGVSVSWGFFAATWRRFPAMSGQTIAPVWAWKVFFTLFLVGHYYCWRQRRIWIPVLYWLCFALAHLALFLIPIDVPYTEKYLVFLYPLYMICVAAGITQVVTLLERAIKKNDYIVQRRETVAAIGAIIVTALYWGDLYRIYTMEIDPTKRVLEYFKDNAQPDDVFLTSGFTPQYMFYAPQFGFVRENFVRYTPNSEADLSRTINKYISQDRNVWFVLWSPIGARFDRDESRELLQKFFTPAFEKESYFSPSYYSQEVFKLDRSVPLVGSKAVFVKLGTPRQLPYPEQVLESRTVSVDPHPAANQERGQTFALDFTTLMQRDYYFSLWLEAPPESVREVRLAINDTPASISQTLDIEELHWISQGVPLNFSQNKLHLDIIAEPGDSQSPPGINGLLSITNGNPTDRTRNPDTHYRLSHYLTPTTKQINNITYTEIDRAGYLEYSFSILSAGNYELMVEGLNDSPATVVVQADINGRFNSFLAFDKEDHTFTTKSITLPNLTPGKVFVTLHFLNSIYGSEDDELNRVMGLRQIRLRKLPNGASLLNPHPRLPLFNQSLEQADTSIGKNGRLSNLWTVIPDTKAKFSQNDVATITLEPYWDKAAGLMTNPISFTNAQGGVYVTGELNIEIMENHTFNILILMFDDDGQLVHQQYMLPTGYMVTEGWEKFAAFTPLAPVVNGREVKAVMIGLVAYPNGIMPGEGRESFSIRNVSLKPR